MDAEESSRMDASPPGLRPRRYCSLRAHHVGFSLLFSLAYFLLSPVPWRGAHRVGSASAACHRVTLFIIPRMTAWQSVEKQIDLYESVAKFGRAYYDWSGTVLTIRCAAVKLEPYICGVR